MPEAHSSHSFIRTFVHFLVANFAFSNLHSNSNSKTNPIQFNVGPNHHLCHFACSAFRHFASFPIGHSSSNSKIYSTHSIHFISLIALFHLFRLSQEYLLSDYVGHWPCGHLPIVGQWIVYILWPHQFSIFPTIRKGIHPPI